MLRKTLCRLLCCIAILCLAATSVFAAGYFNGSDQPGSIVFDFNTAEHSVSGGSVDLRMVACWDNDAKTLKWCEGYADVGISLENVLGQEDAARLFIWAESKSLPATRLEVGEDGTALAEGLTCGLYLVSQITPFTGYECMLPALISVPLEVDGQWILDVEASPKLVPLVQETTAPPTKPTPPPLPPTGQVNWPIPLLFVGGSFLILLGLCLRKQQRHETDT